jgi:hypothetical protein
MQYQQFVYTPRRHWIDFLNKAFNLNPRRTIPVDVVELVYTSVSDPQNILPSEVSKVLCKKFKEENRKELTLYYNYSYEIAYMLRNNKPILDLNNTEIDQLKSLPNEELMGRSRKKILCRNLSKMGYDEAAIQSIVY